MVKEILDPWGNRVHCGQGIEVLVRGVWQWGRLEVDSRGEVYFVLKVGTARVDDVDGFKFQR